VDRLNREPICGGKLSDCYPPVILYGGSNRCQDVASPLSFLWARVELVPGLFLLLQSFHYAVDWVY
jgi:hypothetical protein